MNNIALGIDNPDIDSVRLVQVNTTPQVLIYPSDSNTKTWPINFLPTAKFPQSPATAQAEWPMVGYALAHSIKEDFVWIQGTITLAYLINNVWWINPTESGGGSGTSNRKLVRLTSHCGPNASKPMQPYSGTSGSEVTSGGPITVWNRGPGILMNGLFGFADQVNGNWYWQGPDSGVHHTGTASGSISAGATGGTVGLCDAAGVSLGFSVQATNELMTSAIVNGAMVHVAHNGKEWRVTSLKC